MLGSGGSLILLLRRFVLPSTISKSYKENCSITNQQEIFGAAEGEEEVRTQRMMIKIPPILPKISPTPAMGTKFDGS